ncbi:hypothetical protein HDU67_004646 [Dinochytrium kinnereticum]|nr:hypothetical protein HDU67_004646 [Dinochytrium kinnereticum]
MHTTLKKDMKRKLPALGPSFNLPDLLFPSFLRNYGYKLTIGAADAVHSLSALLDCGADWMRRQAGGGEEEEGGGRGGRGGGGGGRGGGEGGEGVGFGGVGGGGVQADGLGGGEHKKKVMPLVIAAYNDETDGYLVLGMPDAKRHGDVRKNIAFQVAAERTGVRISNVNFDTAVAEVPRDDLVTFIESLQAGTQL